LLISLKRFFPFPETPSVKSASLPFEQAYIKRLPGLPSRDTMAQVVRLLQSSKKPVVYCGGGCLHASEEVREFVELMQIPVAQTLMGLGTFPEVRSKR
jgi:thiamine pyrophosphate-dependent acetolactate synthase large subunit-like protein